VRLEDLRLELDLVLAFITDPLGLSASGDSLYIKANRPSPSLLVLVSFEIALKALLSVEVPSSSWPTWKKCPFDAVSFLDKDR
jgi:hypothetical protein